MLYANIDELEKLKAAKEKENFTTNEIPTLKPKLLGKIEPQKENDDSQDIFDTGEEAKPHANLLGKIEPTKKNNAKLLGKIEPVQKAIPEPVNSNYQKNEALIPKFKKPQTISALEGRVEEIKKNGFVDGIKKGIGKTVNLAKKALNKNIEIAAGIALQNNVYKYLGGRILGNIASGKDTIGMMDIAQQHKNAEKYTKQATKLKNYKDGSLNPEDSKYLEEKTRKQFGRDGFDIDKIPGYHFKYNSEPSIRIVNNPDFRKNLIEKKEEILKNTETSGEFLKHGLPVYPKSSNLHYAIGHYDLRNIHIDKDGNFHAQVYDTYDFNEENKTPINQAGRKRMLDGNLQPFFTIHDIFIRKEELDKFW